METDGIEGMSLGELQRLYLEVIGERTRCPNRQYLVRRITAATAAVTQDAAEEPCVAAGGIRMAGDQDAGEAVAVPVAGVEDGDGDASRAPAGAGESGAGEPVAGGAPDEAGGQEGGRGAVDGGAGADAATATESTGSGCVDGGPAGGAAGETPLRRMSLDELRAKYAEVVGRETSSSNGDYLVWKIRQVRRGGRPAVRRDAARGTVFKVIPLRLSEDSVGEMDAFWRAHGFRSRTEFIARAVAAFMVPRGCGDA